MFVIKNERGEISGEMLQFLIFDLVSQGARSLTMSLNVQKIKEVVDYANLSSVPTGCENVIGIYDLRGCPVPIVNILALISSGTSASVDMTRNKRILICELQGIWIGIPVETTGRIFSCPSSAFLPPPLGSKIESRKIITGLVRKEGKYIPVLDLDTLLNNLIPEEENQATTGFPKNRYLGKRVLVVDDSRVILKRLSKLFIELGFTVETATNGSEALQRVIDAPRFDLLFTDIEMPLLDGVAMAREIKRLTGKTDTPILFNSALSNPAFISDIEKEGLGQYLVKFDEPLILKHLTRVFGS